MTGKHIVIDARIRRASTGKPIARLIEYLQELDTKNRYTVLVEPNDPWEPQAPNFIKVACPYPQFSFSPLQQITFARFLYKLRPDLVHFTLTGQQPLGYFGQQITMTHDLTMYEYVRPGKLPLWLHQLRMLGYRLLMWSAHQKAQRIIVPTEYVAKGLAGFHPFTARKITVTLEASEPPIAGKAQKPNIVNLDKFILYVGSAFPHKNLETLIKSFEVLQTLQPELKLLLVGKREYHSEQLEKFADQSPARKNIVFTGFVSDTELKWLYQNAEAYVFPSLSEGFGLPGLEAMVHGCPVVSSNATCLPEVNGDAAIYFDPQDEQNMADKINLVLTDKKLRKELVEKGSKQAAKFSWHRMTKQTLDVYNTVLSE